MKSLPKTKSMNPGKKRDERLHYERPVILYEGQISTRAGSPTLNNTSATDAVDPADLFGEP